MTSIAQLWLPILVSGVLVFIASSLIHMVFKWHNAEYRPLANEDEVRAALRAGSPAPGLYVMPYCMDMKAMGTPEMTKKFEEGPVAFVTMRASGPPRMGGALVAWFVFTLGVASVAAYLAGKTLAPTADAGQVCRVVALLCFAAYGGGSITAGIWMGKPWSSVAKELLDAAIYAALTAATFAWLWPK
jgi:hypothetical protein